MARNGSGTFSLLAVMAPANTVSSSTTVNNNCNDIATALTESINKDGTKAWAANQSLGTFKFTSVGDGSARTDSIALGQVQDGKTNWIDGGGTADAITATYSPAITTLVDGQICFVRATAANTTTTPTFAPNGLTARTIVKNGGVALLVGDIVGDNHELILKYFLASTRWELLNPANSSTGVVGPASATDNAIARFDGTTGKLVQNSVVTISDTTGDITSTCSDDGATVGPHVTLDRLSASPAAADVIGGISFNGRDSGAGTETYAGIRGIIIDPTAASEDGALQINTVIAGASAARLRVGAGIYTTNATSGDMGVDTINAVEYYKNGLRATRHLIGTLTTTSGTTASLTDIPAYRELYIEVDAVSFTASATMQMAVSHNNGSTYGTAVNISPASGSAGGLLQGTINSGNWQTTTTYVAAHSVIGLTAGTAATPLGAILGGAAGAGGPFTALQFSGGTFDAGAIRVYGLL